MDELKPCPFCGGEAELITLRDGLGQICECWVAHTCANGMSVETNSYDTEAEAISAWNTRAERTCRVIACYDTSDVDGSNSNAEWYFALTCGCELYWDEEEPPNYCPNCGAKVIA